VGSGFVSDTLDSPTLTSSQPTPCSYFFSGEKEGTRLVGHVEIGRGEVLGSVRVNRCRCSPLTLSIITENYNVAFQLEFNKASADGPSLKFRAGFSISELPDQEVSDLIGMPDNTSEIPHMLSDHSLLPLGRGIYFRVQYGTRVPFNHVELLICL
jgi:hypothetical protein